MLHLHVFTAMEAVLCLIECIVNQMVVIIMEVHPPCMAKDLKSLVPEATISLSMKKDVIAKPGLLMNVLIL